MRSGHFDLCSWAKALYDFEGDTIHGELSVKENDILTVTNQDVGEGWWEGYTDRGESGLFPAAYVELITSGHPPPSAPPPAFPVPLADQYDGQNSQTYDGGTPDNDWDEDDWDDDDSSTYSDGRGQHAVGSPTDTGTNSVARRTDSKTATIKPKGFSRFSTFVKTGGEAYILGNAKANVPVEQQIRIHETESGPMWEVNPEPFTCTIANPKKESKYKGVKSYICYQVTPSNTNIQVSRRYKHFDWLYNRLVEKFAFVAVPPLPDKQITGRYEDDFIQGRMNQLQAWLDRMTKHPIIPRAAVFTHFLTCTDDKMWKAGKRRAEKDDLVGSTIFLAIQPPPHPLDAATVESQHEHFSKFTKSMDDSVSKLLQVSHDREKKHQGPFRKEFNKLGNAFNALANSFELDNFPESNALTAAIHHTGKTHEDIGTLYAAQPQYDLIPMMTTLHEYDGLLSTFPDMLHVHKGSLSKVKECQKLQEENKMDGSDVASVSQRADIVSYALMAEINHFQGERVRDFKATMQKYLREQITFYKKITENLERTLAMYDEF